MTVLYYLIMWGWSLPIFAWLALTHTELRECHSDSLNGVRYIIFQKTPKLERGDIVEIKGHREDYVGPKTKLPYSKRVLGIPGDKIIQEKEGLRVGGSHLLPLLKKDRYGKPLNPLSHKVIPQGFVFLGGDNPKSFDSRYEEFGLVPLEKIWGKAIFTW